MSLLLSVRNLRTYFFMVDGVVKAVDGIDLDINEGEVVGLVGESGCGKSTVAMSILRILPEQAKVVEGEILFEGEDLLRKNEDAMRRIRGGSISIVFQNPLSSLNPVFTVGDQIAEALRLHQKIKKIDLMGRVEEALGVVGIPEPSKRAREYPHQYSGGMRQRAMIAMALSCRPKLIIADEPTTALDVTIQAQILELIQELQKKLGSSVLLITHDLGIVAELSDKVAMMYAGKIVEVSDTSSFFSNPAHPYSAALLRSVPDLETDIEEFHVIKGSVPDLMESPPGCKFHPRCEFAEEICKREQPELFEIEKGHQVACLRVNKMRF